MTKQYIDGTTGRGPYSLRGGNRPNMLSVSFDMVPREFYLPKESDTAPRTPNLDSLRADGLFFSNAYCASPLCSPSRAALFTGRYSYITSNSERAHDGQQIHVRADDVIYPEYLKASGYRTRHFGKCHIGVAKFLDAFGENDKPWDRWSPPWYDDDGYQEFLRTKGVRGFRFSREIHGKSPSGKGKGNFLGGWVVGSDGAPIPKDATYPAYVTENALAAFRARAADPRPFYFQVDFFEPHQPFFIPAGYEDRERELRSELRKKGLPESWKAAVAGDPGFGARLPGVYGRYRKYWGLTDENTAADYLVAHVLQYEILDDQIGRLVGYLKEAGLYEGCLIQVTADHGEMNCRGALADKGAYLNPRVLQVPLYLKLPGGAKAGTVVDRAVSLLDVAPTILDAAGVDAEARFDGVSLVGPKSPAAGASRPPILAEVFTHVVPNPAAAIVSDEGGKTRLYSVNFADPVDEYYERDDSGVWPERNGIDDAASQGEIAALRRRMLSVFDADERWVSYAAFLRLIHAETFLEESDLQKFINS